MTDNARRDEGKMIETGNALLELLDDYMTVSSLTANDRYSVALEAFRDALARRSIQEQPEAVSSDKTNVERSPEFEAWVASLPAKSWAKYDLSACRLGWEAARASAPPPIAGAGWKPRGVSDEVVKLVRDAFTDGMEWADKPWGPGYTAWDQSQSKVKLNAMISADSPLHTEASPVPDNTDARAAQVKALEDKIERQARVLCEQANRIRRLRAEVRRHLKPDPYDPRPPFSYRAIIKQNGINFAKFKAAEAERDNVTKLFLDTAKERNDLYRELGEAEAKLAAIIPGTDASGVIETLNDLNDLLNHIDDKGYMLKRAWTPELRERVWSFADRIPAAIRALDPVKAQKP